MTLVRFNKPSLMNKLANQAFYGNMLDSNLLFIENYLIA